MMDSEDYLESVELRFFLKDLKRQIEQFHPEDSIDFALSYFKQVQSCSHVVGTGFSYVNESIHNRKSLVFSLTESFKGFDAQDEITPNEIYHLIEAVCPSFPKSLVLEAAMLAVSNINHIATLVETKCTFNILFRNISCFILYDEWLKIVEECFRNEGKGMFLSPSKLKVRLDEFYRTLPPSIYQPPWQGQMLAVEGDQAAPARTSDREISFDSFKKILFKSPSVLSELEMIANLPQNC